MITTDLQNPLEYAGNGVTVAFDIPWPVASSGELYVGATPMAGIVARNGSTWNDHVTLNLMKAGAWAAL